MAIHNSLPIYNSDGTTRAQHLSISGSQERIEIWRVREAWIGSNLDVFYPVVSRNKYRRVNMTDRSWNRLIKVFYAMQQEIRK